MARNCFMVIEMKYEAQKIYKMKREKRHPRASQTVTPNTSTSLLTMMVLDVGVGV